MVACSRATTADQCDDAVVETGFTGMVEQPEPGGFTECFDTPPIGEHGETPRLQVHGTRREACGVDEPLDDGALDRARIVVAHRAAIGDRVPCFHLRAPAGIRDPATYLGANAGGAHPQ